MADENKLNDDEKQPKKGGEFRVPPRTWIVWIAIFGGIILLMLARERLDKPGELLSQHVFQRLVESNQIAQGIFKYNPQKLALTEVVGKYYRTDAAGNRLKKNGEDETADFRAKVRIPLKLEEKLLGMSQIEESEPNTMLLSVVWSVLPILVIAALIWFFFIRQIKMAGKGALSFGKSKARALPKGAKKK